jgi:hypothetical protein
MSEAAAVPEPPRLIPEQLAEIRAARERFEAGDESDFLPWEDVATEFGIRLGFWVLEERQVVALYNVTWLG